MTSSSLRKFEKHWFSSSVEVFGRTDESRDRITLHYSKGEAIRDKHFFFLTKIWPNVLIAVILTLKDEEVLIIAKVK